MNLVCLIGTLVALEAVGDEEAILVVEARGDRERSARRLVARTSGPNARACLAHLAPGQRIALEGELVPRSVGGAVDLEAQRVQFLCRPGAEPVLSGPERPAAA